MITLTQQPQQEFPHLPTVHRLDQDCMQDLMPDKSRCDLLVLEPLLLNILRHLPLALLGPDRPLLIVWLCRECGGVPLFAPGGIAIVQTVGGTNRSVSALDPGD